eukprot:TRINITY_DN20771_c0_g1_i1.p1 TRINITY_DN20771_c0_g1~~TRINITY_DN20771_c0_g1_i1.p1  ORF type:complete len:1989 (+),score=412.64 TRINITY_DN20771_c0_g1_i1:50-5968(+)
MPARCRWLLATAAAVAAAAQSPGCTVQLTDGPLTGRLVTLLLNPRAGDLQASNLSRMDSCSALAGEERRMRLVTDVATSEGPHRRAVAAAVQPAALQTVRSPARHLYPSFGFGPPVVVALSPAPVIEYVDSNGDRVASLPGAVPVVVDFYVCRARGVDDCIRACMSLRADRTRAGEDDGDDWSVDCTFRCEERSLDQCGTAEQMQSGRSSPWPWAAGWTAWALETGDMGDDFATNSRMTRVVNDEDYRGAGRRIAFGESGEHGGTAESGILLRARFRSWYKLKFAVAGAAVAPAETEPFRLRACYDWRAVHNATRFRSRFRSGADTDNPFPADAPIDSSMYAAPNRSQCLQCPAGAVCDGSTEMRTDSRRGIGYWRADISSTAFYLCDSAEGGAAGCVAGTDTGTCTSSHAPHRWPFHSNPVCSLCADGYGKTSIAGRCGECPALWASWIFAVLVMIVFLLLVIVMVLQALRSHRNDELDAAGGVLVKMLLTHLQIVGLLRVLFEKLGTIGRNLFDYSVHASGGTVGKMVALDCIWPYADYYWTFRLTMVLPFVFPFFAAVLFGPVLYCVKRVLWRKRMKQVEFVNKKCELARELKGRGFFGNHNRVRPASPVRSEEEAGPAASAIITAGPAAESVRVDSAGSDSGEDDAGRPAPADRTPRHSAGAGPAALAPGVAPPPVFAAGELPDELMDDDASSDGGDARAEDDLTYLLGFRVNSPGEVLRAYTASLVVFAFIVYPNLLLTCANMLSCSSFDWGGGGSRRVLKIDMSIDCDSGRYDAYKQWAVALIVVYGCGLPILFLLLHGRVSGWRLSRRQRFMFGFLTAGYRTRAWFWEAFVMLRKLAIVVIAETGTVHSATLRSYFLAWTMGVFWALQTHVRPYALPLLNRLEEESIMVTLATVCLTLLYVQPEEPDNGAFISEDRKAVFYSFTLTIVAVNVVLVVRFVYITVGVLRRNVAAVFIKFLVSDIKCAQQKPWPMWFLMWLLRMSRQPRCGKLILYARDEDSGRRVEVDGRPLLQVLDQQKYCGCVHGAEAKTFDKPLKDTLVLRRTGVGHDGDSGRVKAEDLKVGDTVRLLGAGEDYAEDAAVLRTSDGVLDVWSRRPSCADTRTSMRFEEIDRKQPVRDAQPCFHAVPKRYEEAELCVGAKVVYTDRQDEELLEYGFVGCDVDCVLPHQCPAELVWALPGEEPVLFTEPACALEHHRAWERRFGLPRWESEGGLQLFAVSMADGTEPEFQLVRWILSSTVPAIDQSADSVMQDCEIGAWRSQQLRFNTDGEGCRMPHDPVLHGGWERKERDGWVKSMIVVDVDQPELLHWMQDEMEIERTFHTTQLVALRRTDPLYGVEVDLPGGDGPSTLGDLVEQKRGAWFVTDGAVDTRVFSDDMDAVDRRCDTYAAVFVGKGLSLRTVEAQRSGLDLCTELGVVLSGCRVKDVTADGAAAAAGVSVDMELVSVTACRTLKTSRDIRMVLRCDARTLRISQAGPFVPLNGVGTILAANLREQRVRVDWGLKRRQPQRRGGEIIRWTADPAPSVHLHRFGGVWPCDVAPAALFNHAGSWRSVASTDVIPSWAVSTVVANVRWRSCLPPLAEGSGLWERMYGDSDERLRVVVKSVAETGYFQRKRFDLVDSAKQPSSQIIYEESCTHSWDGDRDCLPKPPRMSEDEFESHSRCRHVEHPGDCYVTGYVKGVLLSADWADTFHGVRWESGSEAGMYVVAIADRPVRVVADIEQIVRDYDDGDDGYINGPKLLPVRLQKPSRWTMEGFSGRYSASSDLLEATTAPRWALDAGVALEFQVWMPRHETAVVISPLRYALQRTEAARRWLDEHRERLADEVLHAQATEPGFQALVVWESAVEEGQRRVRKQRMPDANSGAAAARRLEAEGAQQEHAQELREVEERAQRATLSKLCQEPFDYLPCLADEEAVPWRVGCTSVDQIVERDKEMLEALGRQLRTRAPTEAQSGDGRAAAAGSAG